MSYRPPDRYDNPLDDPDVVQYKALIDSERPFEQWTISERRMVNTLEKIYTNLDRILRPPSTASEASYAFSSLGGASQRTLDTAADLSDNQLDEQWRRTRRDYYHDRGIQPPSRHSRESSIDERHSIRDVPSPLTPRREPQTHYRAPRSVPAYSPRSEPVHSPRSRLEEVVLQQGDAIRKRDALADDLRRKLHEAVDLEYDIGQCEVELAELKISEESIRDRERGFVYREESLRDWHDEGSMTPSKTSSSKARRMRGQKRRDGVL
ncbi:hypothetical protein ACHAPU_011275 [Fusarium lateritium]